MAARIHELLESRQVKGSSGGIETAWVALILDAENEEAAYAAAINANDPKAAPETLYGAIRDEPPDIAKQAQRIFRVEFRYSSQTRPTGDGGGPPPQQGGGPGGGNPDGKPPDQAVGAELSFSTGGDTKHIYQSIQTIESLSRDDKDPPNFHRLIGVSVNGVEGCDIYAGKCEFQISRRFSSVSYGWFQRIMASVATTNKKPFQGGSPGEVLFLGADGGMQPGNAAPWSISGRYAYSKNRVAVPVGDEITFDFVGGWEYLWAFYEKTTQTIGGEQFEIQRPKWAYREQVYEETDFTFMGLDS